MGTYNEINGNIITLAKEGKFDLISHGCNCFCNMGAGLAPQMAKAFGCDRFKLENHDTKGDINKLGQIDYETFLFHNGLKFSNWVKPEKPEGSFLLTIVNSYTQYVPAVRLKPLDYDALTLCMRKM